MSRIITWMVADRMDLICSWATLLFNPTGMENTPARSMSKRLCESELYVVCSDVSMIMRPFLTIFLFHTGSCCSSFCAYHVASQLDLPQHLWHYFKIHVFIGDLFLVLGDRLGTSLHCSERIRVCAVAQTCATWS
jgi:hypothetical protein